MFWTRHLPFDNFLRIASSNQFSPVDIFVKFKVTISRDIGVFSVTLLVKTVRFVTLSYGEHLFTEIYFIPMVPDAQYLKRILHP